MKNLKYVVVDTETTVRCPIGTNKANPHWPENKIVMAGVKHSDMGYKGKLSLYTPQGTINPEKLYVGTNLPFDLQHMYKACKDVYDQRGKMHVWDCQIAEYLLSRQRHKYPSLDDMSTKYGGTLKNDEMKKHWDAGGQTEDIDPKKLEAYLYEDLDNTELVFKAQIKEAAERKMLPLLIAQMNSVMAITEMQYNGIAINKKFVNDEIVKLVERIAFLKKTFTAAVASCTDIPVSLINLDSPKSMSLVLFGGEVKEKVKQVVGLYKNGNPKEKLVDIVKQYKGLCLNTTGLEKTIHGWSTSDDSLEKLKHHSMFVAQLQQYRESMKDYGTYFEPLTQLVFHDGCVHQNLHQTSTDTGRLSCTEPNLQNVTDKHTSEIKKAYISRWGEAGRLVEFDYKQLEIVALAYLSGEPQLIKDCNDGIDIHTQLFRSMFGRVPTDWERKQFKRLSFALIYGSGIKNMAQQAMVSEEIAKNFKRAFEGRYPGVVKYRNTVREVLAENRLPGGHGHDKETGLPLASSYYRLPTGRELYYREFVQKNLGNKVDFSYTQICNYPVQSFATGDIVPIMLGKLYRYIINSIYKDKVLLINTVHDSIMLDIHNSVLEAVIPPIKELLEDVPETMEYLFGFEMTVTPRVSVSSGPSWFEQISYKETE